MKSLKIITIVLNLFVGGMLFYGGIKKFDKPMPAPNSMIEKIKSGEEIAPNTQILVLKNYVFGMKQTGYFWQLLGISELLAGALLISQVFGRIGMMIALPMTLNILLFHVFLEPNDIEDLILTAALFLANVLLIAFNYRILKPLLYHENILKFK
ncbi:MAG: DoxX family membrane protein [Sphingobacteriaceae bacterium]|nr:DoxX family membrane protein [Sphingobacteriaceae bacterium]